MRHSGPQYDADLAAFVKEVKEKKISFYDYLTYIWKATREDLNNMGYKGKTKEFAISNAYVMKAAEIQFLTDNFLKKYPD